MHKLILVFVLLVSGCSSTSTEIEDAVQDSEDDFKLTLVEDVSEISSDSVYTFLCEMIIQKPSESTPNCADFGQAVFEITWDTWTADGAVGRGRYSINDCDPDCASGTRHETNVEVSLENLYTDGARYFLRDFSYKAKKEALPGHSKTGGWDVADFYINVPEMRSDG